VTSILHTFDPSFIAADDNWLQEFICLVLLISLFDGGNGVLRCFPLSVDQALGSDLDPLPSLVAIHGIVSANDGNKLSDFLLLDELKEFLCVLYGGTRSSVPAIPEEVDIDMWDFELLRGLKKCEEVVYMGMDTTIRDLQAIS